MPERYAASSPLTYVDAVKAPVHISAGVNDPRCPIRQIDNYVDRLAARDAVHEVYRYDAGHGSLVVEERIKQVALDLAFAAKHLGVTRRRGTPRARPDRQDTRYPAVGEPIPLAYRGGVYRFLRTPRWWGIDVFVLLAIPFCVFMGTWQLGKFEDRVDSHQEAEQRPAASSLKAAPLATLLPVDKETSGRSAEARGRLGSSSWCRSASWTAGPVRTS
ncbi:hypothetical protein SNARM312S_01427 [Streptomyces narbonensis]